MNCFMIQKDFEKESCSISKIQIDFTKHYTKWFQNHDKKRARKMHDFLSLPSTKCVWTNFVQFQNLSFSQCENYGNLHSHFSKKSIARRIFFCYFYIEFLFFTFALLNCYKVFEVWILPKLTQMCVCVILRITFITTSVFVLWYTCLYLIKRP